VRGPWARESTSLLSRGVMFILWMDGWMDGCRLYQVAEVGSCSCKRRYVWYDTGRYLHE